MTLPTGTASRRSLMFLTYGAFAACVIGVLGAAGRQQQVFRGITDTVHLFVTVTDRDGRLVTTLTRDDFEVRDEGKRQPITVIRDPQELRTALPERIAPDAPTPLWRAIDEALNAFGDEGDERRVVLVLSDGKDSGPIGFRERFVSQAEVIDRARDDVRRRHAQPRRATDAGHRSGWPAGDADRRPSRRRPGPRRGGDRRRLRRRIDVIPRQSARSSRPPHPRAAVATG